MKAAETELNDYERALSQLNDLPPEQARTIEAALNTLLRERDEARAHLNAIEKILSREIYIGDQTAAENIAGYIRRLERQRDEARAAYTKAYSDSVKAQVEAKFLRERQIYSRAQVDSEVQRSHNELRELLLQVEWITDHREASVYCHFCHASWMNGHKDDCEAFGPSGVMPRPKTEDNEI